MVADYPDHTLVTSILQTTVSPFPITNSVVGTHTQAFTPDLWANALILTCSPNTNVSYAAVVGNESGLTYLSVNPTLDGGIYAFSIFPSIDTDYTLTFTLLAGSATVFSVVELGTFPPGETDWRTVPNAAPACANGTIAGNASLTLVAAAGGVAHRLHSLLYTNTTAAATQLSLQDQNGTEFARWVPVGNTSIVIPLYGRLSSGGIVVKNLTATATSATQAFTLDYSNV